MTDTTSTSHWGALYLNVAVTPSSAENNAPHIVVFPSATPRVKIGRGAGNDVVILNPCISATHCIFYRSVSTIHIAELQETIYFEFTIADTSTNGCYVNGVIVGKGNVAKLKPGDRVELVRAAPERAQKFNMSFVFQADEVERRAIPSRKPNDNEEEEEQARGNKPLPPDRPTGVEERMEAATAATTDVAHKLQQQQQSDKQNELEAHIDEVVLQPDVVADDVAVGEGDCSVSAALEATTTNESNGIRQEVDSSIVPSQVTRESTVDFLRRRHQKNIEIYYCLDKQAPLGAGSFATVYSAALRQDHDENRHPTVLKLFFRADGVSPVPSIEQQYSATAESSSADGTMTGSHASPSRMFDRTYAVKVIKKHRLLIPASQQESPAAPGGDSGGESNGAALDAQQEAMMRQILAEGATAETRRTLFLQLTPLNRKVVEKELKNRQRQQREIDILLSVHHTNIVSLYEIFESPSQLCFVMELCQGGELFPLVQAIGALPEFFVKLILFQVVKGVQYLHQVGIAHRDLKLENVLLAKQLSLPHLCRVQRDAAVQAFRHANQQQQRDVDTTIPGVKRDRLGAPVAPSYIAGIPLVETRPSGLNTTAPSANGVRAQQFREWYHSTVLVPVMWWPQVKISDFGLSRALDARYGGGSDSNGDEGRGMISPGGLMSTMCGTPLYAAPEVTITSLRSTRVGYTEAVDLFSVGVLCFALLCGRPPFPNARDGYGKEIKGRLNYTAPLTWERHMSKAHKQTPQQPPTATAAAAGGDDSDAVNSRDIQDVPYIPISAAGRDFTARLLRMRPSERMSATEALAHPWLAECVKLSSAAAF